MIPFTVASDREIMLSPSVHDEIIKDTLESHAPWIAPWAEITYMGDTGNKCEFFEEQRLAEFDVTVDRHGKMLDMVLYFEKMDWFLLIQSFASRGPVDAKRHKLANLFSEARPDFVYVTAFPDRGVMGRYLVDISWEKEVWCAGAPTHVIHFEDERFLGSYERADS